MEDFADLTPALVRGAYVEALYRAEEWDYSRLTRQYWEDLLKDVSKSGDINTLLQRHPMRAGKMTALRSILTNV